MTSWLPALALMMAGCAATQAAPDYAAILTNTSRPENERALDAVRKPNEVMAFYGVKKGDKVADIYAARGYYTAILSQLVGPDGLVYAANPAARPELHERAKQPSMANVRVLDGPLDKLALPQDGSLDFVFIHLDYHEIAADARSAMNRRIFGALKRGGAYGVVDHSAAAAIKTRNRFTVSKRISSSRAPPASVSGSIKKGRCSAEPTTRATSA